MRRVLVAIALGIACIMLARTIAAPTAVGAAVTIVDLSYSPASVTIVVGGSVGWTNADPTEHTVTSQTNAWSAATLAPQSSFQLQFPSPGTYPYFCTIHPSMTGTVTVIEPSAATSTAQAGGAPVFLPLVRDGRPTATATGLPAPTATATATSTSTPTRTPGSTPIPTPTRTPTVTPTPTLPPPSYNNCQADPNPGAAPNYPVRITAIDKVNETVTLRNETTSTTINLTGWQMCSITGNQHHPISGTLAPGESRTFQNTGGPIWNNSVRDDGALYNPNGQLVSYWVD